MTTEHLKSVVAKKDTPCEHSICELIPDWIERLHDAQVGHYVSSEILYTRADRLGYALIISSTIVTAMLFLDATGYAKILMVFMSIVAASLSGVVSFARFAEKAEQHRSAAGSYGKLRRQLEKLDKTKNELLFDELDSKLKVLRIEWEYVSQNAPLTPKSALKK
ncbi:SLATT domain-containing protein [Vibrio cyclitrophicus]